MKKRRFFAWLCSAVAALPLLLTPVESSAAYTLPASVEVTATSAMVVYLEATASGLDAVQQGRDTVLYEKDPDVRTSPAAMVRVMVGLYAVKLIRENNIDIHTATGTYSESLEQNHIWGTGLSLANMEIGETWTIDDLLSLSMIQTAADACVTLAYALCGSVDAFVLGMNRMAQELGCTNTAFTNVHGLDDAGQYTTARDMYILLRCALDYPELEQRLMLTEHTVRPVSGGSVRSWENTNYMLRSSSDEYYEPLTLGKTGVSETSGRGLVSVAEDSGYRYMAIVLGCPDTDEEGNVNTHYENSRKLYNWAFNNFTYKALLNKYQPVDRLPVSLAWDTDTVTLVAKETLSCLLADEVDEASVRIVVVTNEESLEAPIEKGEVLGKAELYIQLDQKIGEVELIAGESVSRSEALYLWKQIGDFFSSPWFWITAGLLLLLAAGYILLTLLYNREKYHSSRRARKYKSMK